MKKYLILLLLLIIPFGVNGKEINYENHFSYPYVFPFVSSHYIERNTMTYYSYEYVYENGLYTLVNPVKMNLNTYVSSDNIYTCYNGEETSCSKLYSVYPHYIDYVNKSYPSIALENGATEEDLSTFKAADSFSYVNNKYILNNPEEYHTYGIVRTLNNGFLGKYICANLTDTCDELLYIEINGEDGLHVLKSSDDYIYSRGFEYRDGKYYLKDIVKSEWPNFNKYIGLYSCVNKEESCDKLYRIKDYKETSYYYGNASIDMFGSDYYTLLEIDSTNKVVSLKKSDKYDVSSYIINSTYTWIEDESILKIEDNKIVPLKKGTTNVLFQKEEETILLKVTITELNNPKTGVNYIVFGLFIIISFGIILFYKKYNIFR